MQSFKQISYQNYIQLRFNQKNLEQTSQQQALLKYKRNAQLLAEIFAFDRKPKPLHKAQPVITEQALEQLAQEVERQKEEGQRRCVEVQEKSKEYCRLLTKIRAMSTEEQRREIIQQLKKTGLYDDQHPYFVQGSPFYLNSTDEEVLEVQLGDSGRSVDESTLTLFQIK